MTTKEELIKLAVKVKNRFNPDTARKIIEEVGHAKKLVEVPPHRIDALAEALARKLNPKFYGFTATGPDSPQQTIIEMPHREHQPAFVKLGNHERGTTLIMQQQLVTHIETTIDRKDAAVLVRALCEHFGLMISDIEGK